MTGAESRDVVVPRGELERRTHGLALVAVTLCVILSGCAGRITPELPSHMIAAADIRCCGDQATDNRATRSMSSFEAATSTKDPAGGGLCLFEVAVSESPLRRDAFGRAPIIGRVVPGERLTALDFIDRRLRVLGRVVFDGGYWRKVRGQRGDVGWIPAAEIRAGRSPCEPEGVAMGGAERASE